MMHHLFDCTEKNEHPQDHYQYLARWIGWGIALFVASIIWHAGSKVVGA